MDPRVVSVRILLGASANTPMLDLSRWRHQVVHGDRCQHVRIEIPGDAIRLDVVDGPLSVGPIAIEPAIDLSRSIDPQLAAIRRLDAFLRDGTSVTAPDARFRRLARALRVIDARADRASLRDIGLFIVGGDDWPGDGEHLKSHARRLVVLAGELSNAGPRGVLNGGI